MPEPTTSDDHVHVTLPVCPLPIQFLGNPPFVDALDRDSPLAARVKFGMYVVSLTIGDQTYENLSLTDLQEALDGTSQVEDRILVLAKSKPPPEAVALPISSSEPQVSSDTSRPARHIILKKTWKMKSYQAAMEKSFSFHGLAMTEGLAGVVKRYCDCIPLTPGAQLSWRRTPHGVWQAYMNHAYQKVHEEDAVAAIMDAMAAAGWEFIKQYDTELSSNKLNGSSFSRREMFVFQKKY
eukprot:scaffold5479_cov199-Amphora_coffeaeformis.AAC.93